MTAQEISDTVTAMGDIVTVLAVSTDVASVQPRRRQ